MKRLRITERLRLLNDARKAEGKPKATLETLAREVFTRDLYIRPRASSKSHLSRWNNGVRMESVTHARLRKLAEALNCTEEELVEMAQVDDVAAK